MLSSKCIKPVNAFNLWIGTGQFPACERDKFIPSVDLLLLRVINVKKTVVLNTLVTMTLVSDVENSKN